MFEYLSFRSRPEELDGKLNTYAIEGWKLFSIQPDMEKHGIWYVVMKREAGNKQIIED